MNRLSKILPTVAIPLIFTSIPAFAGELQFNVPATERAAQSAEVLARAAHAIDGVATREGQLSNLWVFPTRDADTVFARYTLTSTEATSPSTSTTDHLALVTLRDNGTVKVRELAGDGRETLHWSASIGNGHTTSSHVFRPASAGAPASPHWTASIGTGRATEASESGRQPAPSAAERPLSAFAGHWSSRIGTARATEANDSVAARASASHF